MTPVGAQSTWENTAPSPELERLQKWNDSLEDTRMKDNTGRNEESVSFNQTYF